MTDIRFGNYLPSHFHGEVNDDLPSVRVALVGTGLWGFEHARAFSLNPHTELVAICGRNQERVSKRAAEFNVPGFVDLKKMLDEQQPDLVSLCLGNLDHFKPTLSVLEAGFPAFVEKPFVFDLEEGRRLLEVAAAKNLFFAINFNHRYAEPFLRSRALVEQGELGDIVFASWRFGGNHEDLQHPHANLIETQCHGIDMLLSLVGPIETVSAEMTDKTGKGSYSTVALAMKFKNGAVGDLLGSYDTSYAYPEAHRFEINGTRGRILIEDTVRRFTFNRVDDPVSQVWQSTYFDDESRYFAGSHDRHVAEMIRAFRNMETPPVPAQCGFEVLKVCHAAIESFETGRRIAVSD